MSQDGHALFHSGVPSPTTCSDCHGLSNGGGSVAGTNNDIPSGLINSDTLTVSTSSYTPPANTYAKILHTDINVAGKDCNVCHTNAGSSGPKWRSASFHSNVLNLASGTQCLTCHSAEKPPGIANGMDHSNIGAQDCSSCHHSPGSNVAGSPQPANWTGAFGVPLTYTIPSHTVSGLTIPGYTGNHTQTNTNCTSCHGADSTYKSIVSFDHQGLPSNSNTCISCHLGSKSTMTYIASTATLDTRNFDNRHHKNTVFFSGSTTTGVSCIGCHSTSKGSNTFNNASVVYPSSAKTSYINIGCGSVNGSTFSCHNGSQRTMVIPVSAGGSGRWK